MNKNRFFISSYFHLMHTLYCHLYHTAIEIKQHQIIPPACIFYLFVFLITGCGDLKTTSYFNPPEAKLSKYEALEIADFETEIGDLPNEALTIIPDEVTKLLASKKTGFQKVERETIQDIPAENTLVLLGEVTEYQSGKSFKAEGGALKIGEAALTVQLSLVEKATGNEIASGEVSGLSSIGFLRSGFITKGVYEALAEEIVKFISENY